jgi:glutathione S-transferase
MAIKLYGGARSRASIVHWYLEELGLAYEFVMLDMQAGEHRQAPFTTVNPFGKVPAIEDGDFKLWESGAILLYLDEKYGPAKTTEQRAIDQQWVLFANATVATGIFVEANREREMPRLLGGLSELLTQSPYITGETFGVSDVALGSILAYIPMMLKVDLSPYPGIAAYLQRLGERPAFQKAIGNRA